MPSSLDPVLAGVVAYYDAHPINEDQILNALSARGVDLESLTEEDLQQHDQDHYGGLAANDRLIALAGVRPEHVVLDVCSGMGGPARYLAHRVGCRVVGLDLTESRYAAAQRLTRLAGLDSRVGFRLGNALDMPFEPDTFDVVIGQEAWCHVPDKPKLVAEIVRVLKPGGAVAFTDILERAPITEADRARLRVEMNYPVLQSLEGYAELFEGRGCRVELREDLSEEWTRILVDRLAMYRSLKADTIRKFGEQRFADWDRYYSFFVGCYAQGKLGGGRFLVRKG